MMRAKVLILYLIMFLSGCGRIEEKHVEVFDLDKILERGSLKAITGYNAYSYFIYKGEPKGFEYELMKKYCDHLGVKLELIIVKEIDKMFEMLIEGKGDIIAFNLTVTKERLKRIDFSNTLNTTKQVLVQRRPEKWHRMMSHEIDRLIIKNPLDLEGKTVYVRSGSSHLQRLRNLSDEIGGDINIIEASPQLGMEDLIEMVSMGEIDYTIADDNVALLNQAYYSNIDVSTDISMPQKIAWGIRKNVPLLKQNLNEWIDIEKKKTEFYVIRNRYFKNRRAFKSRITSQYFSQTGGRLSEYDDLLKEYSKNIGWDWRLLAAMVYQESQFDPEAKSWVGASGLMQLMPATAAMYGVDSLYDPHQNVSAGIKYIKWLDRYWSPQIQDSTQQMKFILASYNVGLGHIIDARNLAEKYNADSFIWDDNVEKYLLLKSKEKYYKDEVVQYGYCRGIETVNYVKEILERYEHYRLFVN
ncbi:transglycosylase SLT domain-containing protein [Bacteroidota bacterium]